MDTRLLTAFVTLARTGGFTASAAELHLAQSTVTVQIRTLERELGARLFDRLPTGAVLTDAGRRLLAHAEQVLDAEARLLLAATADLPITGRVAIGAPESLCAHVLPGVIASLRRSHPGVDVQLTPAGTVAALEGLRAGRLSLALVLETDLSEPDLAVHEIDRQPLAFVAAPEHPLAGTRPDWAALAAEDFFVLEEGCSYSDGLVRDLHAVAPGRLRCTRLGSVDAARACVAAGLGLTLLPVVTVAEHLADGRLVRLDGPPVGPTPVLLARHGRRSPSPAATAVMAALRATNPTRA